MVSSWAETSVTTGSPVPAAAPRGSDTTAETEHAESGHQSSSSLSDPKESPRPSLRHRQKGNGPGDEAFSVRKLQKVRGGREWKVFQNGRTNQPGMETSFANPLCQGATFNLQ